MMGGVVLHLTFLSLQYGDECVLYSINYKIIYSLKLRNETRTNISFHNVQIPELFQKCHTLSNYHALKPVV